MRFEPFSKLCKNYDPMKLHLTMDTVRITLFATTHCFGFGVSNGGHRPALGAGCGALLGPGKLPRTPHRAWAAGPSADNRRRRMEGFEGGGAPGGMKHFASTCQPPPPRGISPEGWISIDKRRNQSLGVRAQRRCTGAVRSPQNDGIVGVGGNRSQILVLRPNFPAETASQSS